MEEQKTLDGNSIPLEEDKLKENELEGLEEDEFFDSNESDTMSSLIAQSNAGVVYDWTQAPDTVRAPPRQNLDGQIVKIVKAEIILPPLDGNWEKTRDGQKEFKYCTFKVYYEGGQQEFYSGVKVFKTLENGVAKYTHPTIYRNGKNQASRLLQAFAKYKGKAPEEVSMKEFMAALNSGLLKGKIKNEAYMNPETGEEIRKNIVVEFVD